MIKLSSRTMAVIGILLGMAVLAAGWSSINMSLASIQSELKSSLLQLQWMMNLYGISICIALLPLGKLGDAYGRKLFYIAGLVGLGLACLGAGSAKSPEMLIAFMALFGLSGASVLTLSQALTVHQFPENQKSKAIAIWATFTSIALSVGPLLGGVIIKYLSWRWVFYINVPIAILALVLVSIFVKKEKTRSIHCDWSGVILFALIVGALVSAIMQGPSWGWGSLKIIGLFALAFISLISFIITEKRSSEPLFQPKFFAQRGFLFASICNGCLIGFIWSIFFFVPLYLQNERNASPLDAGITMLLITLPVALFSMPVSKLYERVGPKILLTVGFALLFISVFFQSYLSIEWSCIIIGFGWVLTWGPSASKALSSLPHHMAGMASGMFMSLQEMGGVLGLAISGVAFHTGINQFLSPKKHEICSALKEYTPSLLTDPKAAESLLPNNSPILDLLHQGFKLGYENMLFFLSIFMLVAIIFALLIPKVVKYRKKNKSL